MDISLSTMIEQLKFYAALEFGRFWGIINFISFISAVIIVKISRLTRIIGWGFQSILMAIVGACCKDKFKKSVLPEFPKTLGGPHEMLYFLLTLVLCVLILAVTFK